MKVRSEEVLCAGCGGRWSATMVERLTTIEADALGDDRVRELGTVTCPACGYWIHSPLAIRSDAGRFTDAATSAAALRRVGLF